MIKALFTLIFVTTNVHALNCVSCPQEVLTFECKSKSNTGGWNSAQQESARCLIVVEDGNTDNIVRQRLVQQADCDAMDRVGSSFMKYLMWLINRVTQKNKHAIFIARSCITLELFRWVKYS